MPTNYEKRFRSSSEQIALLRERGMRVHDDEWASELLSAVGYSRLSGYFYGFREFPPNQEEATDIWQTRLSTFIPGTDLQSVNEIYEFDRRVRMRIFDGIEKFEIALRFTIGHLVAQGGPFAHRDSNNLSPEFTSVKKQKFINFDGTATEYEASDHSAWLVELDKQEARSQEAFAIHHRNKYGGALPIWKATEVMQFGTLVALYDGLQQQHREQVAAELDILDAKSKGDITTLSNWLNHVRYVRNTCAHHSRLWNRNFNVVLVETPRIPELAHLQPMEPRTHIYGTIAILSFLLARTHPGNAWRDKTIEFVTRGASDLGQDLATLGFPEHWDAEVLWSSDYQRDAIRAERIQLLSSFETRTTADAGEMLHATEPKNRKSQLRYLRTNHALLGLKISETYQYPEFQFDREAGTVAQVVVEANRRLSMSMVDSSDEEIAWATAAWWLSPHKTLGDTTPTHALQQGKLTLTVLDRMLPGPAE